MKRLLELPHRVCESTCYINGLEDILEWKGVKYPYYLLSALGGIGEFTYLKFKIADPPCMVYWGASPKYLLGDLEKIIGFKQLITENKVFKNTFPKIKKHIDNSHPVVAVFCIYPCNNAGSTYQVRLQQLDGCYQCVSLF